MMRQMIPLTLVALSMFNLAANASSIDAFAGRWDGQSVEPADAALDAATIGIEIVPQQNGFELSWKDLGQGNKGRPDATALEAQFVRTNRQGVFELVPTSGSFLDRMFASPDKGNPLDGETLLWARIDSSTLAVYSLTIDKDGGFDLDHYAWTRTDAGLDLQFREQSEELGQEVIIRGQLVQAGG